MGALALLGGLLCAAPAAATGYSDAIELSWDGTSYASSTTESFLGLPVSIPGDSASRTLQVRNSGPSAGTLTATISEVVLDESVTDGIYDDLLLSWPGGSASFADLSNDGETTFLTLPLAQGASTPVTVTYSFPEEATTGNRSVNGAAASVDFDVVLTLSGELPTDPATTPPATTPPATTPPTATTAPPVSQPRPNIPFGTTGAEVTWVVAGALALLAGGGGLWAASRRRRRNDPTP